MKSAAASAARVMQLRLAELRLVIIHNSLVSRSNETMRCFNGGAGDTPCSETGSSDEIDANYSFFSSSLGLGHLFSRSWWLNIVVSWTDAHLQKDFIKEEPAGRIIKGLKDGTVKRVDHCPLLCWELLFHCPVAYLIFNIRFRLFASLCYLFGFILIWQ